MIKSANVPSSESYFAPQVDEFGGVIDATVTIPGSKSLTNRYLVLNYLSAIPAILHNQLISRDTDLMIQALDKLKNAQFGELIQVDTGLAGTVMRFVPPLAALRIGVTRFDGDAQARLRPMGPILATLEALGVDVIRQNGDYLPFAISGNGHITGGRVEIDASTSSQFISGLLLSAASCDSLLQLVHVGKELPSLAHIDMTVDVLSKCGVQVNQVRTESEISWTVAPQVIQVPDISIEPDLSNAGPFLAAAMANPSGGCVRIPHWPQSTTQPGEEFVKILPLMGASIKKVPSGSSNTLQITSDGGIYGVDVDLSRAGEITPTVAALCTLAQTASTLRGIGHLRGHETDRLVALVTEIRKLGREAEIVDAGTALYIGDYPSQGLHSAVIESYNDHRMATFGAIIGLRIPNLQVTNIATTAKTMPDFVAMWAKMLKGDV